MREGSWGLFMDVTNKTSPDLPADESCGATWRGGREVESRCLPVPPIDWRFSKFGLDSLWTKTGMYSCGKSIKTVKPVSFSLKWILVILGNNFHSFVCIHTYMLPYPRLSFHSGRMTWHSHAASTNNRKMWNVKGRITWMCREVAL